MICNKYVSSVTTRTFGLTAVGVIGGFLIILIEKLQFYASRNTLKCLLISYYGIRDDSGYVERISLIQLEKGSSET